jgi:hypothetical protein
VVSPSADATDPGGATSIVDNTPPGTSDGDLLLARVAIETAPTFSNAASATITAPAGWTTFSLNVATAGTDLQIGLYYKIAAGADAGGGNTYTWNFSTTVRASALIENYFMVGATPIEGGPNCQAATSSTTITAPSLTTGKANDLNIPIWVSASHQFPSPTNANYSGGFEPGTAPTGVGPLLAVSNLVIPLSGTMTGNQTATITIPADNIGCQINLSPLP